MNSVLIAFSSCTSFADSIQMKWNERLSKLKWTALWRSNRCVEDNLAFMIFPLALMIIIRVKVLPPSYLLLVVSRSCVLYFPDSIGVAKERRIPWSCWYEPDWMPFFCFICIESQCSRAHFAVSFWERPLLLWRSFSKRSLCPLSIVDSDFIIWLQTRSDWCLPVLQ